MDVNCDYISNLPDDIKEKILAQLSLKEAVRTSFLSSSWKDSWTSHPNLVFEEKSTESRLIELVDKVLQVHRGPIRKFKLVSRHDCNEAIGYWMLILSTNGIEHLGLEFKGYGRCVIPFRFFSCNALKYVCLSGCSINAPEVFNEFTLLHTLCLYRFNLSGFSIEKLVSSCPLLEHLDLDHCVQQGCLRILAPKLTFLHITGDFHDICLETPKLVKGSIYLLEDCSMFNVAKDGKESKITRALGRLSNIRKLNIYGLFLEYLAMGPIPKNLPAMFNHLSEIYVELGHFPDEIATLLCLFQNAPNLTELCIQGLYTDYPPHVGGLWESKATRDCLFKRLKVVIIMYGWLPGLLSFGKAESMLQFAKLVLSTAPLLEVVHVTDLGDDMVVFEEIKLFPKLSEKCRIVLLKGDKESYDDENE